MPGHLKVAKRVCPAGACGLWTLDFVGVLSQDGASREGNARSSSTEDAGEIGTTSGAKHNVREHANCLDEKSFSVYPNVVYT